MKHKHSLADSQADDDNAASNATFDTVEVNDNVADQSDESDYRVASEPDPKPADKPKKHHQLFSKLKHIPKKWLALGLIITLLLVALVLLLTPAGYPVIGKYFTQDVQINATDDTFRLNLTDITIELDGQQQTFKGEGPFVLHKVPSGNHTVKIIRQYYEDFTVSFSIKPLGKRSQALSINSSLKPTGRPVLINVSDTISGSPLAGAKLTFESAEATSNDKGEATVVLPSSANEGSVEIKKDGYNTATVTIKADGATGTNSAKLTPSGRVYFFSKRTGKIDLYSSNLDGTDAKLELAATGNETDEVSLYTSPDRRWLAFNSTRDGTRSAVDKSVLAKVFVLDTTTGKLEIADEGDATFWISGFTANNKLLYGVRKNYAEYWNPLNESQKIKLYNPDNKEIKLVYANKVTQPDATNANGQKESLSYSTLLTDKYIVYTYSRYTYYGYCDPGFCYDFMDVADLEGNKLKSVIKEGSIYNVKFTGKDTVSFYTEKGSIEFNIPSGQESEYKPKPNTKPTPNASPNGQQTAWSEERDGQSVTFIGDKDGGNEKQIASRQGLSFLQWYNEDYILLLSQHDEYALHIISVHGGEPVKISNIHSYSKNYYGY